MDKVKQALTDFTSRSGHHDTTVHENVAPAVQHETVKPHVHENINTAVDKEVHQDHYHRTVQPVHDREVLPETHTAKLGGVQHREFDHRDHDSVKRNLAQEQAQFKDQRQVEGTTHSQSVAPTVGGEHVHHHIHETIQPVVHKETVQPNVVHTTVPIHEVHHNKATHHESTALPAMTMDEFKNKGGVLSGREERYDEFEGVPKNIGGATGGTAGGFGAVRDTHGGNVAGSENHRHGDYENAPNHRGIAAGGATGAAASGLTGSHQKTTAGPHDGNLANKADPRVDSDRDGRGIHGTTGTAGAAGLGSTSGAHATHGTTGHHGTDGAIGHHDSNTSSTHKKPGLMDKLNPKKDTDGDGKAGIMD